jgi:hypothetical protein
LEKAGGRGLRIVTGDSMLEYQLPFWADFFEFNAAGAEMTPSVERGGAAVVDK